MANSIKPPARAPFAATDSRELWNRWRCSPSIRELAEDWITQPQPAWTVTDQQLAAWQHDHPSDALATIFAIMQLTQDGNLHALLAAGPLEDFLGLHGENCWEVFCELATQEDRLRHVLNGVWQGSMPKNLWRKIETLKPGAFTTPAARTRSGLDA